MGELVVKIENCYGIKKLDYTFGFESGKPIIIHASNGVMKTSFLKTLKDINVGQIPKDIIEPDLISKAEVFKDTQKLGLDNFYLVDSYDANFKSKYMSNLMINKNLKEKYYDLTENHNRNKQDLISSIAGILGLKIDEVVTVFSEIFKKNTFEKQLEVYIQKASNYKDTNFVLDGIDYFDIFNSNVIEYLNNENTKLYLKEYEQHLRKLYRKTFFLKEGIFEYQNLISVKDSLTKNKYFDIGNTIKLAGQISDIKSIEQLDLIIKTVHKEITEDKYLVSVIDDFTNRLNLNNKMREFSKVIRNNPNIIQELLKIEILS